MTITRHGAPVVELRPAQKAARPVTGEALAQLRAARERLGVSLSEGSADFVPRMRDEDWQGR